MNESPDDDKTSKFVVRIPWGFRGEAEVTIENASATIDSDDEALQTQLNLMVDSEMRHWHGGAPAPEYYLAHKVVELFGGKIILAEEVPEDDLPPGTVY